MTPDIVYDQLIGAGCARKLTFSWGGNPGVGSLHRFRDAVENGWPQPLEIEEHSHAGMADALRRPARRGCRSACCAATSAPTCRRTPRRSRRSTCPFTGEQLTAVPALNPDVAVIHAQQADRAGNVQMWGLVGVQKEACSRPTGRSSRSRRSSTSSTPRPGGVVLPAGRSTRCARCPAAPTRASRWATAVRDNAFYQAWDAIARDRDTFTDWIDRHILSTADFAEYRRSVGLDDNVTSNH